jgi:hypothetical protein
LWWPGEQSSFVWDNWKEGDKMMINKTRGFFIRAFMLALVTFMTLPAAALAQGGRNSRDRNDRWERDNDNWRRNQDNNDRWNRNNRRGRANDGYGNYGGSFDLRQTALNAGFADGAKEGRRDRSRNEGFNFSDESGFQKATRDYSSRLGNRNLYQRYYRQAFENGYRDGYAGY